MAETDFDDAEDMGARHDDAALVVDVDGFEGPLDLLLELARRQKVDLHRVSILALADQYLAFIEEARRVRLELAADYLVMAAWLAYLKSRLLLPAERKAGPEPSAEELAGALAERLRRLEAIRRAAAWLADRPQLGRDVFVRGMPEEARDAARPLWTASLHDLLTAYARQRERQALARVTIRQRAVWSLAEARQALERLVGEIADWAPIDAWLTRFAPAPAMRRTAAASTFACALELAREGRLELRQDRAFGPLWLRGRAAGAAAGGGGP